MIMKRFSTPSCRSILLRGIDGSASKHSSALEPMARSFASQVLVGKKGDDFKSCSLSESFHQIPSTLLPVGKAGSTIRLLSSQVQTESYRNDEDGPTGVLFSADKPAIGPDLVGAMGHIQRTFGPRSNAEGLLATGGAALAAHASFDPDYSRAQDWIRHHAVGPAVLSPILIAGLTGALTEAAFPQGINVAQSMRHKRPLIVGVTVAAMIEVLSVNGTRRLSSLDEDEIYDQDRKQGFTVLLRTVVTRVRDDCIIAEGTHELWVPDYCHM